MCRLMAYIGSPMLLADIVLWPDRSIIKQSYDARERKKDPSLPSHLQFGNLNGDGFGIGWFSPDERRFQDPSPCVFTAITPAWNNENLSRLSAKIISPIIFAHVRAAYPGMPVSEQNCHPFQSGRYLWMHNGVVGGFAQIRRSLLALLSDHAYNTIQSFHSDSAVSFALFLQQLPDTTSQQPPDVLLRAMQDTMAAIARLQQQHNITCTSLLNFVVSDGATLIATRYVWPDVESPASLYYAEGASFERTEHPGNKKGLYHSGSGNAQALSRCGSLAKKALSTIAANGGAATGAAAAAAAVGVELEPCPSSHQNVSGSSVLQEASYDLTYGERGAEVAFIASEPITGSSTDWVPVPKNTAIIITREKGGLLNTLHAPLTSGAPHSLQGEVAVCLEAVARGLHAKARPWLPRDPTASHAREAAVPQHCPYQPSLHHCYSHWDQQPHRRLQTDCHLPHLQLTTHPLDCMCSTCVTPKGAWWPSPLLTACSLPLKDDGGGAMAMCGLPAGPVPCHESDCVVQAGGWRPAGPACTGPFDTAQVAADNRYDWQDTEAHEHMRLAGHEGAVLSALVDDNQQRLYTASVDCSIKVWSLTENKCIQTLDAHKRPVTHLRLRGRWLFSACGRKLRVWDTKGFKVVQVIKLTNGSGNIRSLEVSDSGGVAYLGCQDSSIQAFFLDEARLTANAAGDAASLSDDPADAAPHLASEPLSGHVGCVNALALCCSKYLCSGSADAMIRVWTASGLKLLRVLRGHRGSVGCLLAIDNLLLSGARDNTIRVWDMDMDMTCRRTLTGHKDDVMDLASVALKSQPGARTNGAPHPPNLSCTVVASASADGTIRLWSLTWTCLCILSLPPMHPERLHPWSYAGSVTVATHQFMRTPAALCAALSRGLVVAGYADGEVRMWHCEDVHQAALQVYCSDIHLMEDVEAQSAVAAALVGGAPAVGLPIRAPSGGADLPSTSVPELSNLRCAATAASARYGLGRPLSSASAGGAGGILSVPTTPPVGGLSRRASLAGTAERLAAEQAVAAAVALTGIACSACNGDGTTESVHVSAAPASALGAGPSPSKTRQLPGASSQRGGMLSAALSSAGPPDVGAAGCGCRHPDNPPLLVDVHGKPLDISSHSLHSDSHHLLGQGSGLFSPPVPCGHPSAFDGMAQPSCFALSPHVELRSDLCSPGVAGMTPTGASTPLSGAYGPLGLSRAPSPSPYLDPEVTRLLERRMTKNVIINGAFGRTDQQMEQCLREFVRIKSVSSDPALHDECMKGAKYLAKLLEWLGASVKVVQPYEDKNPVVLGRLGHDPTRPTVTFYGHYDVQPAAEPDWFSNPFELNSVNEYLYGRGISDNKGPILAFIFAVKELLDSCGSGNESGSGGAGHPLGLAVNVAFIFEGEEENGSTGFAEAVQQNLRWFEGTQLIVISNTLWVGENAPCLTYGMRGMLSASIQVSGPERDLHSGNDGGVFNEPMLDLLKVLATMAGSRSDIKVPGFYDGVAPALIDMAWSSLQDSSEFTLEGYKAALGVPALTPPPNKHDLLAARWCQPSLSIVDMRPGQGGPQPSEAQATYRFGPTRFSVIPRTAVGKVSVRFVPNQDADELVGCLRAHIMSEFSKLGSKNSIALHVESRGNWWEAQPNSQWLQMAAVAVRREWGCDPLFVREGGTMPVASALEKMLGAPALLIPLGQSSDGCHLANERIRRANLLRGKNVIRLLLQEVSVAGTGTARGEVGAASAPEAA